MFTWLNCCQWKSTKEFRLSLNIFIHSKSFFSRFTMHFSCRVFLYLSLLMDTILFHSFVMLECHYFLEVFIYILIFLKSYVPNRSMKIMEIHEKFWSHFEILEFSISLTHQIQCRLESKTDQTHRSSCSLWRFPQARAGVAMSLVTFTLNPTSMMWWRFRNKL